MIPVFAMLALSISSATMPAQDRSHSTPEMALQAPIDSWDEAIPLGNGLLGGLLWGKDSLIRLSLDRGDLWDNRLPEIYSRPDWNYKTMIRLKESGDTAEMHRLFDTPYDTIPYPTKLPAGRIEIRLPDALKAETFSLRLADAEGRCRFAGSELKAFFHASRRYALVWIPAKELSYTVNAPAAVKKLGFEDAQAIEEDGFKGYAQESVEGLRYGVLTKTKAAGNGTLMAVTVFASPDGKEPIAVAKRLLDDALRAGYDRAFGEHKAWWRKFWATSRVAIPDERLQKHYDLVKYFYGSASRRGAPPIPLQGVWTADSGSLPPWKGDYHNDLNTQTTYIAYQTAGLFDSGLSFIEFMHGLLPQFRKFAREFYGVEGAVVPGVMTLDGKPTAGWGQYSLSPTNGAWISHLFARHWRYTRDEKFLKEVAHPFCKEIAAALRQLMKPNADGHLQLPLSTSPEIFDNSPKAWLPPMSNYDLAMCKTAFGDIAELERALKNETEAKKWEEWKDKLEPFHLGEDASLAFAKGLPYESSHRHFSHAIAIHPLGLFNTMGDTPERGIAVRTADRIAKHGTDWWVGYSFSWFACMLAGQGRAAEALDYLQKYERAFTLRNGFHANGDQTKSGLSKFTYRPFTLEGNFLAMEAVQMMLLQSDHGAVRLFPAMPEEWKDASFEGLRAEGGFVVSAKRSNGSTESFSITATVGGTLKLKEPFGMKGEFSKPIRLEQGYVYVQLKKGEKFWGVRR